MSVLSEIVAAKRLEIEASKASRPLETLKSEISAASSAKRPFRALFDSTNVLIAEIKPKSPSAGEIIAQSPLDVADLYGKSEADVVSVLTDTPYFGGSLSLLRDVRAKIPQTVFRKDFIIDQYQVYETAAIGADAFLLIASILTAEELTRLIVLGKSLGLGYLVEVHDESDVVKALAAHAEVIGINNRDLATLQIGIATTERLIKLIPKSVPVVSESGISDADEVRKVRGYGARGILVGTSILRSHDAVTKIRELKEALV